jgi:hypothetical protein
MSSICIERLFDRLPQVIQPVQCKRCRPLSTLSTHMQTSITVDKPTGQQVTKRIPLKSQQKPEMLPAVMYSSLVRHKMFTFMYCNSFFGSMANLKLHFPHKVPKTFLRGMLMLSISFMQFLTIRHSAFTFFFCPITTLFSKFI